MWHADCVLWGGQVSQVYWFYVFVTLLPQPTSAQDCHMSVTVESAIVPNGVNKVKVVTHSPLPVVLKDPRIHL